MARYTTRWGLSILGPGDALNADGYKALDADRRLIDRLLTVGTEQHRHTGQTGEDRTPTGPPALTLQDTGGTMPSGQRWYYKYTVIDDLGNESAPSPMSPIDTPAAIPTPTAPLLSVLTGAGTLEPGAYSYVLSAYKDATTLETKAEASSTLTIYGINPASITIGLPPLPARADGFNVYRKAPSGLHYLYITSIANPTVGATYIDDGTIDGDCDRSLPVVNRTSNTNAVLVSYPGATPDLPDGWSWRIYRTGNNGDWSSSYLIDINPTGATPFTPLDYMDIGAGTQMGSPPVLSQVLNSPPKIQLTDAEEVDGYLPPGLSIYPHAITFSIAGPVTVGQGEFTWVCPFDEVRLETARAYLSITSVPAATDVIADILLRRSAETTWTSIFDTTQPTVPVDTEIGEPVTPTITDLALGDQLVVDVLQSGGGATPTDMNLSINVVMLVRSGSTTTTYPWLQFI